MRLRGGGRWRPLVGAGLLACLAAAGCTLDPEVPQGLTDPVAAGEGVCGLLAIEEIEVALNRPLAGTARQKSGVDAPADVAQPPAETATPGVGERGGAGDPLQATAPDGVRPILPGMRMCSLGAADSAGVAWGVVPYGPPEDRTDAGSAEDDPRDEAGGADRDGSEGDAAADAFRRYARWHAPYVEPVPVEGAEATWDEALRTLVVFTDDRVVGVRLPAPPDSEADDDQEDAAAGDDDDAAREQALGLALRALRRL